MNDHVDWDTVKNNGDFSAYMVKNVEANELRKPSNNIEERHPSPDWQKLLNTMRNAASIISLIISLLKILQDLGLL